MTVQDVVKHAKRQPFVAAAAVLFGLSTLLGSWVGLYAIRTANELDRTVGDLKALQIESCEFGNKFRREDMPAAFDEYTVLLGEKFQASADAVHQSRAEVAAFLTRLFPVRNCMSPTEDGG